MLETAGHIEWTPDQFWRATFHDFTAKLWQRRVAATANDERKNLSPGELAVRLKAMASNRT